jgi:hypothetical protein
MPFPYAYYREEYNGPLHGTELESPVLYLAPSFVLSSGGSVDVSGKSYIDLDTTLGSITITNLTGAKDGQCLIFRKSSISNSVTFQHNASGAGKIILSNGEDLVLQNSKQGGAFFICRETGGIKQWFHVDSKSSFGSGTVLSPSISFGSDSNSGMFRVSENTIGFASGGLKRFQISLSDIRSEARHLFVDGSEGLPSIAFLNDSTTGFFKETNKITFTADGVSKIAFGKDGNLQSSIATSLFALDGTTLQGFRVGNLLVSNLSADSTLIPADGVYSKGSVRTGGQFIGTATSALYADLAERYESDANYPVGTIVSIGGPKEISISTDPSKVFGILSSAPGFKMNSDAGDDSTHPYVALAGRVMCRVVGPVLKGEPICLSGTAGVGQAGSSGQVIGRALEDNLQLEEKLVLVVTRAVI